MPQVSRIKSPEVAQLQRSNLRLRAMIDEMREQIAQNRRDLSVQFRRIADLQADVDVLKKALSRR
jgi:hypothetical protein